MTAAPDRPEAAGKRRRAVDPSWALPFVGSAALVAWLGYRGGAYGFELRSQLTIVVWWVAGLASAFGLGVRRPTREATAVGSLLAAYAAWTGLSALWAPSVEQALLSFDRAVLYLGLIVLVVLFVDARRMRGVLDGMAAGLTIVALVALVSRLFPGTFGPQQLLYFLPGAQARLSFPVNYWNGLGILLALAVPLLLRAAANGRPAQRALAVAPFPVLSAAIYLTGSRGGIGTACVGATLYVALAGRRWAALGAAAVAAAASLAAVVVLLPRHALLDAPFSSTDAAPEGHGAAAWIAVLCLVAALVMAAATRWLPAAPPRSREVGWALTAAFAAAFVAALVAVHPVQRFEDFKQPRLALASSGAIQQHLLGGGGTGRWQLWVAAVSEFRAHPVLGGGAGTYGAWWTQHGSLPIFVQTAHSLYLQTLGELGPVGLLVLIAFILGGVGVGARRLVGSSGASRDQVAATLGAFVAWALACSVDWVWELTIDAGVGIVLLGLLLGPRRAAEREVFSARWRLAIAGLGVVAVLSTGAALLTEQWVGESQTAAAAGDLPAARDRAQQARSLEPWASSPYLQLALVDELSGDLVSAQRRIDAAVARSPNDWKLWLVRTRIATEAGHIPLAERSLARLRALNPRAADFAAQR